MENNNSGATALRDRIIKSEKINWRALEWLQSTSLKTEVDLEALIRSLQKNGMIRGFHVWEDPDDKLWIIDGHHMKKAIGLIEERGLLSVPDVLSCYFVDCDSKEEAAKFVLLHSASYAKLTAEGMWEHLQSFNLDVEEFGAELNFEAFNVEELESLVNPLQVDESEDDFATMQLPEFPVSEPGDRYELISPESNLFHAIVCGDAEDAGTWEKLLGEVKPALMVTDPPYGVKYDASWRNKALPSTRASMGKVDNDHKEDWRAVWALNPAPVAYVWHAGKFSHKVGAQLEESGYELISQIIWAKTSGAVGRGDYHWKHEPAWYCVKKGAKHNWQGARDQWTVWTLKAMSAPSVIKEEGQTGHSTQKPLECMRRPIINNSAPGEAVVDPFLGSGSTLIAAEQSGRQCYGIEIDPVYVDIEVARFLVYMRKENKPLEVRRNGEVLSGEQLEKYKLVKISREEPSGS